MFQKLQSLLQSREDDWRRPSTPSGCASLDLRDSRLCMNHTVQVIANCAANATLEKMNPFLNLGESVCGYVKYGSQALNA